MEVLARTFEEELREKMKQAKKECKYNPTRFNQMLAQYGGVETARRLIASAQKTGNLSEGLSTLWSCGRLDLSMECFVLLFNGICQRRKSAQHSKSTCNCLATRAAVTSAFSFSALFIACCAATARERMRAGEMYGYADR